MKLMKWLKRDRSNRRCSDSHVAMVTSPPGEKYARNNSLSGDDPIRTKEYLQALSEFRARRSLGLNLNFDKNINGSPERTKKTDSKIEERKSKSDQKPKRQSLPESCGTHVLSQTVPQIQFLFSNQIFMPGNRPQNKKRNRKAKTTAEREKKNIVLDSPNFPGFKNSNTDFDAGDSESPPADFFRKNSLPYVDKDPESTMDASNSSDREASLRNIINNRRNSSGTRESQRPLLNSSSRSDIYETIRRLSETPTLNGDKARMIKKIIEELTNYGRDEMNDTDIADTSIDSITRKLEEKSFIHNKILSKGHFRGVPLVRRATLTSNPKCSRKHSYAGEGLMGAQWDAVPVTLRGTLDVEYTARDIDILSSVHHPNILLLMGIAYDADHRIECVFEECSSTLFDLLYEQKLRLTLNTCVEYLSDIASAVCHLFNSGFVHTAVSSHTIAITAKGVAKLHGFELCGRLIVNATENTVKKKKCEPYKLIYSSPEPEYENIKGRFRRSNGSEADQGLYTHYHHQCAPQDIEERELLTHFRWQAPELFDDVDKLVTPTKTTDVYSICLVLWECFNGVIPWRTLSYKHLSDLYLLWQTGIRLKEERYPVLIHDILSDGLSLDPEGRMTVKDLCTKLRHCKRYVNFGSDGFIGDASNLAKTNTDLDHSDPSSEHSPKFEPRNILQEESVASSIHSFTEYSKTSKTDIAENNASLNDSPEKEPVTLNLSSIRISGLHDINTTAEFSPEQEVTMNKTDSTEYCSVLTPDIRKFTSHLQDNRVLLQPTQLSFDESLRDIPEGSLQEKIKRLNSNFTPKSYKPLEIKTPHIENLQEFAKFAERVGTTERDKIPKYHFDIKSTSLPNTPIARNTKIRKYAWLAGVDNNRHVETFKGKVSQSVQTDNVSENNGVEEIQNQASALLSEREENKLNDSTKSSIEETKLNTSVGDTVDATPYVVDNDSMYGGLSSLALCMAERSYFRKGFFGSPRYQTHSLSDRFRSRSQSWSCRPESEHPNMRGSENDIPDVDIKPLVAIHEKWIQEAKQKHNRSMSLPDNYRGSAHAVKPASHRVDPALPYSPNNKSHSFITSKKIFKKSSPKGHYQNIPNQVRAAVAKKMTIFPKPDDFFESSHWKKQEERGQLSSPKVETTPFGSSTPYKNISSSRSNSIPLVDQATNTETFEELCEIIIKQIKMFNVFEQNESRFSSISPTVDLQTEKDEKESLNKVSKAFGDMFNGKYSADNQDAVRNHNSNNKAVRASPANLSEMDKHHNAHLAGCKNMKSLLDSDNMNAILDEDCQSLPELRSEVINKTLKRCQAFSALQTARSTEDMYIDDELSANNDVHALSDNMLLIPMHGSLHEAMCDKASNCCLVKIKEESSNETILIMCDNSQKSIRPRSSCSNTSESELEQNDAAEFSRIQNLRIEALPAMNLIDVTCTPQALSVIEEIENEEEYPDSDSNNSRNIQNLISMYEVNSNRCKNTTMSPENSMESRANEISFLILDNTEECDEDLPDTCDMIRNNEILSGDSVIQDYITI